MDDMDFTKPQAGSAAPEASAPFKAANSRFYNAEAAAAVFRAQGREERFTAGQVLFTEDEKTSKGGLFKTASRMYYLADGQVALTIGAKPLDIVNKGEVFGEMAVISGQPRSATATAKTDGVAYSLDASELQGALGRDPEFALMLASVMYDRLRFIAAASICATRRGSNTVASRAVAPGARGREARRAAMKRRRSYMTLASISANSGFFPSATCSSPASSE